MNIHDVTKLFDLEYFDGPLLSLFADANGNFYLYKWYDVASESHQWLVFSVKYDIGIILEFLPQTENLTEIKSSLKELIMREFGKEVDICREKYLKPYYRNQILQSAIYV